jgi:hypothetical protein
VATDCGVFTGSCECEKKALKRTRRVLDAFANRIGNNTWQTPITEEGLDAIKKLLKKTASKNTLDFSFVIPHLTNLENALLIFQCHANSQL